MDYILTTDKLTKTYKTKNAADAVSLHVKKGEVYGLIGRNGAGKTTILKILCGLSKATSGSFTFLGMTGADISKVRNKIGSLIESPGLYLKMTAFQNIKLKCLSLGINDDEYIYSLLNQVGLSDAVNKYVKNFSLGMKQRLGIAIALVGDPEFLILDEPINGLDPYGIAEMREIIHKLSKEKGITIIVSSHILDELAKVADSIGIINNGKLIDEFSIEDLDKRCGQHILLRVSDNDAAINLLNRMNISDYTITDGYIKITSAVSDTSILIANLVSENISVYELFIKQSSLEEYYLDNTREA